jgi:hypothetical protein
MVMLGIMHWRGLPCNSLLALRHSLFVALPKPRLYPPRMSNQETPSPHERLVLLSQWHWPLEAALAWFDLPEPFVRNDLAPEVPGLLSPDGKVDRVLLERALQVNEIAGLTWAALQYGLPRDALREVLRTPPPTTRGFHPGRHPFSLVPYRGTDDSYLISMPVLDAWLKAWLPRDEAWTTLGARAKALAEALGISTLPCHVSQVTQEPEPQVATVRCIATWDFVALHHSEPSAYPKLVTLPPDRIGWHAIQQSLVSRESLWADDLSHMHDYFRTAEARTHLGAS